MDKQNTQRLENAIQANAVSTQTQQTQWLLIGLLISLIIGLIMFYISFGSLGPLARALSRRAKVAASQFKVFLDQGIETAGNAVLEVIEFLDSFVQSVQPILDALSKQLGSIIQVIGRTAIEYTHQLAITVQISIDQILRPIDAFFKYTVPAIIEVVTIAFDTIRTIIEKIYNTFDPNNCGSLTETFTTL